MADRPRAVTFPPNARNDRQTAEALFGHPLQYAYVGKVLVVHSGDASNDELRDAAGVDWEAPIERFSRCPTCEQWSPCDVRKAEQVEAASKAIDDWCQANPADFEPVAPAPGFGPAPERVTVSYLTYDRRIIAYIHRAPDGTETVFKPEEIYILREAT